MHPIRIWTTHSQAMLQKLGRLSGILTIIALLDGHALMFQCYAWATMLYDRVPDQGVEQAVGSTFSGDAPCPKCLAIKAAQEKEQEDENKVPAPIVPESSTMAKFIPNVMEKIRVIKPAFSFVAYGKVSTSPPSKIYLSTDVPPPDFC